LKTARVRRQTLFTPWPGKPIIVSRETGVTAQIQQNFVYSDGFGREIQTKAQAEPDRATPDQPRWIGTGTKIYNNKGKPVQQL